MIGMFVSVFLLLFRVLSSKSAIINLKASAKRFFIALGIGANLIAAKIIAYAIASNDFHYLLPSLVEEIARAFFASFFVFVIFLGAFYSSL